jgi:hypothetical protein
MNPINPTLRVPAHTPAIRAVSYRNPPRGEMQLDLPAELPKSASSVKVAVSEILKKLSVSTRKQAGVRARYSQLQ